MRIAQRSASCWKERLNRRLPLVLWRRGGRLRASRRRWPGRRTGSPELIEGPPDGDELVVGHISGSWNVLSSPVPTENGGRKGGVYASGRTAIEPRRSIRPHERMCDDSSRTLGYYGATMPAARPIGWGNADRIRVRPCLKRHWVIGYPCLSTIRPTWILPPPRPRLPYPPTCMAVIGS